MSAALWGKDLGGGGGGGWDRFHLVQAGRELIMSLRLGLSS